LPNTNGSELKPGKVYENENDNAALPLRRQWKGGFMQEARKLGIAYALDVIGWIVMVLSVLAAGYVAMVAASTGGNAPMVWAALFAGAVSGLLLIAFATVVQQLHEIAGLLDKCVRAQPMPQAAAVLSAPIASR
jgi:hypothetical protein